MSIEALPNELLLNIIGYLPGISLSTIRLVNKRWCELSDTPLLQAKFHFISAQHLTAQDITQVLITRPALISLIVKENHLSTFLLFSFNGRVPLLTY
jgi:hypothetical protein